MNWREISNRRAACAGRVALVFSTVLTLPARAQQAVVDVPSVQFPTIQAAIDAVQDGTTIRIAPGNYRERLLVDRKQLTLIGVGNKGPTIVGTDRENGVITYSHGGGGAVRNLRLHRGAFGVAVTAPDNGQVPGLGTTLSLETVLISGTGRGVYGTFDTLSITNSTIAGCAWNGASIEVTDSLAIDGLVANGNKGVGLLLFNIVPPPGGGTRVIKNSYFTNNKGGGLHIRGGALPVEVRTSTVTGNTIFGIHLAGAHNTIIVQCNMSLTKKLAIKTPPPPAPEPPTWGDGLRVFASLNVSLEMSTLTLNDRAGLSVFGCADRESHIDLKTSALDLDTPSIHISALGFKDCTKPDGTPNPQTTSMISDSGGNMCNGGACAAVAESLTPISVGTEPPK